MPDMLHARKAPTFTTGSVTRQLDGDGHEGQDALEDISHDPEVGVAWHPAQGGLASR